MNFKQYLNETFLLEDQNYDLRKKYLEFNKKYFNNELPLDLSVLWMKRKSENVGGRTFPKGTRKNIIGVEKIEINQNLNLTSNQLDNVLIHEMIHALLFHRRLNPKRSHGKEFTRDCVLYCNVRPCWPCFRTIVLFSHIKKIVYSQEYKEDSRIKNYLDHNPDFKFIRIGKDE